MTLLECIGCAFLAFGPPFSMFMFTIAKDPIRIIILIASAFFWLSSLLFSSLLWFAVVPLRGVLAFGLLFSVLIQELFRFIVYKILKRAENGLKKVTDSDSTVVNNIHILAYVGGLGFGIMSGAFSLVNVLADAIGPGTVGLKGDSDWFILTSALTTLAFLLLHTAWGVLFFDGLENNRYIQIAFVPLCHLFASALTLLNAQRYYPATIIPIYGLLIASGLWAFKVSGASAAGLKRALTLRPVTLEVSAD